MMVMMVMAMAMAMMMFGPSTSASPVTLDKNSDIINVLNKVTKLMSTKYNMGISTAFYSENSKYGFSKQSPGSFTSSAGFSDAGLGMGAGVRHVQDQDVYVWGSITKMFTGPAVLQLVEQGVVSLNDPISMHVDPFLMKVNNSKLIDHFGDGINDVLVHHLLHMTSGVPDYDGDPYAQAQFENRSKAFSPIEILGTFTPRQLEYPPGTRQNYCSLNYILLGMLLANHDNMTGSEWNWNTYNQKAVLPISVKNKLLQQSSFVNAGRCEDHTMMHGFMESYSTASLPPQDVWNVSCAGGWTAGNYLGPVSDVAQYTYALYNTDAPEIVSKESLSHMLNFSSPSNPRHPGGFKFYGMGTFSLDWSIGHNQTAYGHVGDTYGYQSQTTYIPASDFVLTVATNIESNSQAQPADFTCLAYNEIAAVLNGNSQPNCNFTVPNHFIGVCTCTPGY